MMDKLRHLAHRVVAPLLADDEIEHFTLAIRDAATTTYRRSVGWPKRPPATLCCPNCDAEIYQHRPWSDIECPDCWQDFPPEEFPELELLSIHCPRCGNGMDHGRRHPKAFDVPQWATCSDCQFHWEYAHSY